MSLDELARRWLQCLVSQALDVDPSVFDQMLTGTTTELVQCFFSTTTPAGSVLFFYKTDDIYQVEEDPETIPEESSIAPSNESIALAEIADEAFLREEAAVPLVQEAAVPLVQEAAVPLVAPATPMVPHVRSETRAVCHVCLNTVPAEAFDTALVFLIKVATGPITIESGPMDVPSKAVPTTLELGCTTGDLLATLEGLICHVFMPLVDPQLVTAQERNEHTTSTSSAAAQALKVIDAVRHEFKSNVVKFASHIAHARQRIQGDVHLIIPDVVITTPEAHVNDADLVNRLEHALNDWSKSIARVVEQETRKQPKRKGPVAEIEFWRERHATLSTVYDQLSVPAVLPMLKVLDLVDPQACGTFKAQFSELAKFHVEAKDNVKFLITLERHFKHLTTGSFATIAETLPSMMNAIRMVWIISRHYNTDERMVPLMERIASELIDKVAVEIHIGTLLHQEPEAAGRAINEAKSVLEAWHTTYQTVRERIEASGTDHRWEFDRKRLFEQTDYMAHICANLHVVATVLHQFHQFLGPELKAVTGDAEGIDRVMARVATLLVPFDAIAFPIFERGYKTSWDALMVDFYDHVTAIEALTQRFIDSSFQKLRSAEGALDLFQKFQTMQSRESIHAQMMAKFTAILVQYAKEVERLAELFHRQKHAPPVAKASPPVAGAIAWARGLYLRAKKPMVRFRALPEFATNPHGEGVKDQYLVFARAVDAYIHALYHDWYARVPAVVHDGLKQSILGPKLVEAGKADTGQLVWKLPPRPFSANFAPKVAWIIQEAKALDRLGFALPEPALNVTLQEETYLAYVHDLSLLLSRYETLVNALTPVETHLLRLQLQTLEDALRPGFSPLNWTSQRIGHFIEATTHALHAFATLVQQLQKSSKMVEALVVEMETTVLLHVADFRSVGVLEVSEFYELVERKRVQRLDELVQQYRSIGPLLIKIEELVAGVNTGTSAVMATYYMYWERRLFNAITHLIIASMTTFQALLNVHTQDLTSVVVGDAKGKAPPVCKVQATMHGKDILVTPSLAEMYKYLSKCVKHLVESAKAFIRWMHGTCRETAPLVGTDDDEPIVFTFYTDISQNPYVIKMTLALNQEIHKVVHLVNRYLDGWRRYDTVYNLWNPKRQSGFEKLVEKNPSCVYFDTRMAQYARLAEVVRTQPTEKDVDFLQIQCQPLALAIAKQAERWKDDYGRILYELSTTKLAAVTSRMDELETALEATPTELDALKTILTVVATIHDLGMEMELEYTDVIERYRTLDSFQIFCDEAEKHRAFALEKRWHALLWTAKTKDLRLVTVKEAFRGVTRDQVLAFAHECQQMRAEFIDRGPGTAVLDLDAGLEALATFQKRLQALHTRRQELATAEKLFALPVTSYPALQEVAELVEKHEVIYGLYTAYQDLTAALSDTLWIDVDLAALTKTLDDLEARGQRLGQDLRAMALFGHVHQQLASFRASLPVLQSLKNEALKPRHWDELMAVTRVHLDLNPKTLTVQHVLAMKVHGFSTEIDAIVTRALHEQRIEHEVQRIHDVWAHALLELVKYQKGGTVRGWLLRGTDDLYALLDDHVLNLQTMATSRFLAALAEPVRAWEKRLGLVHECLDLWCVVQRKWLYLESIFVGTDDIRQQLPDEARKFDTLNKAWTAIMAATAKNPNVLDACTAEHRVPTFQAFADQLDTCQKSLREYLQTKRTAFPRFFFISDDELLSVLSSAAPTSIQGHMLKLFENVQSLAFGRQETKLHGMESAEGEACAFETVVGVDGPVETWMTRMETEMHASLHWRTKEGVFHYARTDRLQWLEAVLGMVSLVGSQIWWTWQVHEAFERVQGGTSSAVKDLAAALSTQLTTLVTCVRSPLTPQFRKKVNTLLIIDVHARDIVASFVRESVMDATEFAWDAQLRFYWRKDLEDVAIAQCTGSFRYGYEYMGLNGRLVITPLTDRCCMTLTQALTFNLGGAPAGPAGTGKTETVKDLAKALAVPCYVLNCGDGLDYQAMGRTFAGLLQVGAWGCFDEFNRIPLDVLSVVSAQLSAIQQALKGELPKVEIGVGAAIPIRRRAGWATCGVFITMNPGYAGRTELPDTLKALFRPVTMVVPDLVQICQIMLFSEGFEHAVALATKMTVLYHLAKEQLSPQAHYDFGLRALKSVLVLAGALKRTYHDVTEDLVLMRALRDSNMPKFVFDDVPLFHGLLDDLFPGVACPRIGYATLTQMIARELARADLDTSDAVVAADQVDKILQFYETMAVRHTTMIVGPTGGGKTVIIHTLAAAYKAAWDATVRLTVLNPKAQPVAELYGTMDATTREWTDGVFSRVFRALNQPLASGKGHDKQWLVLDGDVDAVWVENLNSVMDDNKVLTLPNGERIRLQAHCALICETFDLQYASPATISRCGMVWVDPQNLGYRPYFERWLKQQYPVAPTAETPSRRAEERLQLLDLFDQYVPPCMDFILDGRVGSTPLGAKCHQIIRVSKLEMCKQLCGSLQGFLPSKDRAIDRASVEGIFLFSLLWSLGAALLDTSRARLDAFLHQISDSPLPPSNLYDHFFDLETHKWRHWTTRVVPYTPPSPFAFAHVFVPTTDSVRYEYLLASCVRTEQPLLFVGESGTAKTTTIERCVETLEPQLYSSVTLPFSSRTRSLDLQTSIQANVDKRSGRIYGPPAGKKLVVFLDDVNMPQKDEYGTQQPLALLHFILTRHSVYDRGKDLELRTLKDLLFLGAMGPPGGGRHAVDPRVVAQFNVYHLAPPTDHVLRHVYGSIVTTYLRPFGDAIHSQSAGLIDGLLQLYHVVLDKLPPTPSKFHYTFNLRDLGRVCEGLCLATPDTFDSSLTIVRLWRHEILRIFSDRLMTKADLAVVDDALAQIVRQTFPNEADAALATPLLFGDYGDCLGRITGHATTEDARLYQDLGSYRRLRGIFDDVLDTYNGEHTPMTLVLFEMALEHLSRILRIIRNPAGHALLIGVGGSGKQSLSRLAAFTAGYELFEITLTRGYGEAEFRDTLRALYRALGTKPVVFLFTDAHVVDEGFLEYLNNMVTTGIVPGLFELEERETLADSVREHVKAAGGMETSVNCWRFYLERCRANLHVILAMSPSGERLRTRCRHFPGLVSATIIDWMFPWPDEALRNVAHSFLADEKLPPEARDQVVDHLVYAHGRVVHVARRFQAELRRPYYVTPRNYLDFLLNYRLQLKETHARVTASIGRLQGGVVKLSEAARAVDQMQLDLSDKKTIVDAKTVACEALIKTIEEKSASASTQQHVATVTQQECTKASVLIAHEKAEADAALLEALPAVEAAAAALQELSKTDLTELKSFASPPPLVMAVCLCVLILKPTGQDLDLDWKGAKSMLSNANLLTLLKEYEKDKISSKMISKIKTLFKNPELNIDSMKSISRAGAGLLVWVVAIVKYHDVARNVDPLRQKVKTMEKEQVIKEQELAALQATLLRLNADVETLSTQYQDANTELQGLKRQAEHMHKRLLAASQLLAGLGSEHARWTTEIASLTHQQARLVGDCLLTASFLSYAGALSFEYRAELIYRELLEDVQSRQIPVTTPFQLETILVDDTIIQTWVVEGLPGDEHSVQNGILTTKARRFPLCIDPQQQAVKWIKAKEQPHHLLVKTLLDVDFLKTLELALQFGHPLLVERVDEALDPILDPILEHRTRLDGGRRVVHVGDKAVEWDAAFRLYLTSTLSNPHYAPEVMGKVTVVNYSVTLDGLTNQLLNVVVAHERPDLEAQFRRLVVDMSAQTHGLVDLEDELLRELSTSSGTLLDNPDLLATLHETKTKAMDMAAKLALATGTKDEIAQARQVYASVAHRGAVCYFAMASLALLVTLYEVSLARFLTVFETALARAPRLNGLDKRLDAMTETVTVALYEYTCTGLFARHQLVFSFHLTCLIQRDRVPRVEMAFFLKGNTALEPLVEPLPRALTWLAPTGWKDVLGLQTHPVFASLVVDVTRHALEWQAWTALESPEDAELPPPYARNLSEFQTLLLVRCFRPDRVFPAMQRFVRLAMGPAFVHAPGLDYARLFRQSHALSPIVSILRPGVDPHPDILALGTELGLVPHRFKALALGQGQGPVAEQLVRVGAARGHWVVLQNCHLVPQWVQRLDPLLASLPSPHVDFRLWVTTAPTETFPLALLQRSIKVVTEPPDGLQPTMRRLFAKSVDGDACVHAKYPSLLYVLCFLHAVVLERRKYGKLGWNTPYDFNDSDFCVSRDLMRLYLDQAVKQQADEVPWKAIKYLIGDAMYGGRVSDDYDRRILATYLDEYMGDFLFDPCHAFYFSRHGFDYRLGDSMATIDLLPLTNSPAVIGLHPNAEIEYATKRAKSVWQDLLALQLKTPSSTDSGGAREQTILTVATEVLASLPPTLDVDAMRQKKTTTPCPLDIVLLQEVDRWHRLVHYMRESLDELQKAFGGEVGMSDAVDAVAHALYNGVLPSLWRPLCPMTEKPLGSWMAHLTDRFRQYQHWVAHGTPRVVWLAGLTSPESYLTALVQTTCRAKQWPLDKSTLSTRVTQYTHEAHVPIEDGEDEAAWYVKGLFLEGASWDRERACLAPQKPKQLVEELPLVQLVPIETSRLKVHQTFRTPVYVTQARRNAMGEGLVFEADLHSTEHPSHWVLQGVALVLNTDQ